MAWLAVNKDGTEWIMPEKPRSGPGVGIGSIWKKCTMYQSR